MFEIDNFFTNLLYLGTIHKVKGKTFEAVLLILKSGYKTKINEFIKNNDFNEELRNIYVAITRPRKILILATPTDEKEWRSLFFPALKIKDSDKNQTDLDKFFN